MRKEVLALVFHFCVTITLILSYVGIKMTTGQSDEMLIVAVGASIGWWFGKSGEVKLPFGKEKKTNEQ